MKKILIFLIYLLSSNYIFGQTDDSKIQKAKGDTIFYQLNEVVITGTRFSKKIVDIPYSITRMDNVDFKYDRRVSVSDVMGSIPGLFMQSRYGNHDVRMSIRGFGSRSNSGIRGIRILLDDIPESEPDGQTRIEAIDFNSVGTIEIVKGNSSSLYTNAPGGVVNFRNDINFVNSSFVNFNDFGSFGLKRNGFKLALRSKDYGFLLTYSYHNYDGYRVHSNDYWHIVNTVLESTPSEMSKLQILGYFVSGIIKLPGSLTKEEFEKDPMQADTTEVGYDTKRISKKGRVGLRFTSYLDEEKNNEIEITSYGTIKYFERTAKDYRVMNRFGLGGSFRFLNKSELFERKNEFAIGGDLFYQTGPVESYKNYNGKKGDQNTAITDETIANTGFFISNSYEIIPEQLSFLLTGRYDKVIFDQVNMINESQSDVRRFEAFTPKAALNYKILPSISFYTSYGLSFDSPAGNEMDNFPLSSNDGSTLLNPDLQPQKSNNFEFGVKGNLIFTHRDWLNNVLFELTFFNSVIKDEIVPFEVNKKVYYRNAAKTNRTGLECGGTFNLYKGLKLNFAYTYSNFKYKDYQAISYDKNGKIEKDTSFTNNSVPSVPKHNLNVSLSYDYELNKYLTLFIKENLMSISEMFVDDLNSEKTGSYNLFNTTLGLDINFNKINVLISCGVNNMTDVKYVAFININSTTKRFYEAGEPRNYFGSIRIGYRL